MKTKWMLFLLSGLLVFGCEKKDTEADKDVSDPPKKEIRKNDSEPSQKEPEMAKKGPETPPKDESRKETPTAALPTKVGDMAAPLTGLEWVKGEPVTFTPGSIYVVEFWATWCPPCRTSIPHLTKIQEAHKNQKVTVIGISKEKVETVKPFVAKMGDKMDYTVAVDTKGTVNKGYMKAFKQNGIPHAFIVNGQGRIVWHGHPMGDLDQVLPKVIAGTFDYAAYAQKQAEEKAKYERNVKNANAYLTALKNGDTDTDIQDLARQILADAPSGMLNQLAWQILTKVEKEKRDLGFALQAAEKANTLTEGKSAMILDTYALALFENGQVQAAIEKQSQAIDMAKGNEKMVEELRKSLEKYQAAVK